MYLETESLSFKLYGINGAIMAVKKKQNDSHISSCAEVLVKSLDLRDAQ